MNLGLLAGPVGQDKLLRRVTRDYLRAEHLLASLTNVIGPLTTSTWTKVPLNTLTIDESGIAKLVSDQLKIPAGQYRARAGAQAYLTNASQLRIRDVANAVTLSVGMCTHLQAIRSAVYAVHLVDTFTVYQPATIELQFICEAAGYLGPGTTTPGNVATVRAMLELTRVLA